MRSEDEIKFQIEGLVAERARLPKYSPMGNNNWDQIDAQIAILQKQKVIENFEPDESIAVSDDEKYYEQEEIMFAAIEADGWLNNKRQNNLF